MNKNIAIDSCLASGSHIKTQRIVCSENQYFWSKAPVTQYTLYNIHTYTTQHNIVLHKHMHVHASACVCVCTREGVFLRACVRACVCARESVRDTLMFFCCP